MLEDLAAQLNPDNTLLFYPSSGLNVRSVLDLPYDQFVFADNGPASHSAKSDFFSRLTRSIGGCQVLDRTPDSISFRKNSKRCLLIFKDNNDVLKTIIDKGREIDCFVGVRDGCVEGGNRECVNDLPFFKKVLDAASSSGMTYYTDHSLILSNTKPNTAYLDPAPRPEIVIDGKMLQRIGVSDRRLTNHPWSPIYKYVITPHVRSIREWKSNRLLVTLEHDTIADHLEELDGVYVSSRCRRLFDSSNLSTFPIIKGAPDHYFMPSLKSGWSTEKSLKSLLDLSEREKWKIVGTTAFGEGRHKAMIDVLETWRGTYPEWIRIFHFDRSDFDDVDELFHKIDITAS